jgi:hypothetical protein
VEEKEYTKRPRFLEEVQNLKNGEKRKQKLIKLGNRYGEWTSV